MKKLFGALLLATLLPFFAFAKVNNAPSDQSDAPANSEVITIDPRLLKAIDLYYIGMYEDAVVIFNLLIESGELSRDDLLRAWQFLGASFILQENLENARTEIIHALKLEPKLTLDPAEWDPRVVNYFNLVKSQVLGSLRIYTEPDSAVVFLNDSLAGKTPLLKEDLVIGDYIVRLEKQGYKSYIDTLEVSPNAEKSITVPLKKKPKLWLWGSAGVVTAGIVAYYLLSREAQEETQGTLILEIPVIER